MKTFFISLATLVEVKCPDSTTPEQVEAIADSIDKYLSCKLNPSFSQDNPGWSAIASFEFVDYQDFDRSPTSTEERTS